MAAISHWLYNPRISLQIISLLYSIYHRVINFYHILLSRFSDWELVCEFVSKTSIMMLRLKPVSLHESNVTEKYLCHGEAS